MSPKPSTPGVKKSSKAPSVPSLAQHVAEIDESKSEEPSPPSSSSRKSPAPQMVVSSSLPPPTLKSKFVEDTEDRPRKMMRFESAFYHGMKSSLKTPPRLELSKRERASSQRNRPVQPSSSGTVT
eukprot:CAMPEP_0174911880 /NCGR_PEP_ID=MMETSP0167-20121228/78569_1 /TAXON_ID=38298 /ORGANISM="Rhodella maculata, Strain CCMP736" /LENGTH=124 /DNA_ID=CAMNT_0016156483 /DNA_START=50 /DNA_END=424 /DNA_ORIENTATION=-